MMLRMTRKTLLAIEAVLDVAYNARPNPVQSRDITERQGIPQRYLEQVLQHLVRKGILTAKGYHVAYTITLLMPYFVGMRSNLWMQPWSFPGMMVAGAFLFGLRARFNISKYALWLPIYAARIAIGDTPWMPHDVW